MRERLNVNECLTPGDVRKCLNRPAHRSRRLPETSVPADEHAVDEENKTYIWWWNGVCPCASPPRWWSRRRRRTARDTDVGRKTAADRGPELQKPLVAPVAVAIARRTDDRSRRRPSCRRYLRGRGIGREARQRGGESHSRSRGRREYVVRYKTPSATYF